MVLKQSKNVSREINSTEEIGKLQWDHRIKNFSKCLYNVKFKSKNEVIKNGAKSQGTEMGRIVITNKLLFICI